MKIHLVLCTTLLFSLSGCIIKDMPGDTMTDQTEKKEESKKEIKKNDSLGVVSQVLDGIAKTSPTALLPKYNSVLESLNELKKLKDPKIDEVYAAIDELKTKEKVLYSDLSSIEILIGQHKKELMIPIEEAEQREYLNTFIDQVEKIKKDEKFKPFKVEETTK